jgi:hypothetical protein
VGVAEIQAAVTNELKKVQKEKFSAPFQKLHDSAKACVYANGAHFEEKKKLRFFHKCLRFFFKKSPKTFGPHCLYRNFKQNVLRFYTLCVL